MLESEGVETPSYSEALRRGCFVGHVCVWFLEIMNSAEAMFLRVEKATCDGYGYGFYFAFFPDISYLESSGTIFFENVYIFFLKLLGSKHDD